MKKNKYLVKPNVNFNTNESRNEMQEATWGGEAAVGIEGMSRPSRWNLPAEEAAEDGGEDSSVARGGPAAQSFETEGFSNPTYAAEGPSD